MIYFIFYINPFFIPDVLRIGTQKQEYLFYIEKREKHHA
jgi:hypothetical protein